MTHPTPYPDVNVVLPSHSYLAIIFGMGGVLVCGNPRHLYRKLFDGDSDFNYPNSWRQSCAA
jgi:hypothetical protein